MKKNIKDYLHLYLGCEVFHETLGVRFLDGVNIYYSLGSLGSAGGGIPLKDIKPILRPLSNMSEEDVSALDKVVWGIEDSEMAMIEYKEMLLSPWPTESRPGFPIYVKTINQLRKMGFDCDELIESGLAIDKTKMNKDMVTNGASQEKPDSSTSADQINKNVIAERNQYREAFEKSQSLLKEKDEEIKKYVGIAEALMGAAKKIEKLEALAEAADAAIYAIDGISESNLNEKIRIYNELKLKP